MAHAELAQDLLTDGDLLVHARQIDERLRVWKPEHFRKAVESAQLRRLEVIQRSPDLFRIGASSLLNDILMQLKKEKSGAYQSGDYFTID